MTEAAIQRDILLTLGRLPWLRIWRQNTGVGRALANDAVIRFGIPGGGDLSGILHDGKRIEIEVKAPNGRQSAQQVRFQAMIREMGGIYILARSTDDALCQLRALGYA